jgi:hypothetical protein
MSNVKEALKRGWMIADVAIVLARGQNDEGRGFLVTLMDSKNHMSREMYLPFSAEAETLLNQVSVPVGA